MTKNPYDVLGVPETATEDEIKSAYRKKAKENHPDLHPDDPGASDRMNEINEAYSILQDPEKLRMWKLQQSGSYSSGSAGGQTYWNPYAGQGQNPFGQQWQNGQQTGNGGYSNFGGWTVYDFSDIFNDAEDGGYQRGTWDNSRNNQWRPRTYNLSLGCLPVMLILMFLTMFLFRTGIFFFILPIGLLWNLFRRK